MTRIVPLLVLAFACGSRERPNVVHKDASVHPDATDWTRRFDFDGDRQPDVVDVRFSGGGHCCYTLAVHLTKTNSVVEIPFELDGGYVGGLSLDQPERFDVVVGPDGIATLRMQIATYGGRADDIPADWRRNFGITSHNIEVDLRDGRIHARDR